MAVKQAPGLPGLGYSTLYRFPGSPSPVSVSERAKPDYVIHGYTEEIYKVIRFKRSAYDGPPSLAKLHKDDQKENSTKLDNNFSRARSMLLQYALCNPWDYFFTGTINKEWYDRMNLERYYTVLSQWIRDKRKEYKTTVQYLLVPERHKDGAWHIHGLLHGLPPEKLSAFVSGIHPKKLVDGKYVNWGDYAEKFGFCSLGVVRDPFATAFYVAKYLDKDIGGRSADLGKHLYFHSRPLKTAQAVAEAYGSQPELDRYINREYPFCAVGMVLDAEWSFPGDYEVRTMAQAPAPGIPSRAPSLPEWEQMQMYMYE